VTIERDRAAITYGRRSKPRYTAPQHTAAYRHAPARRLEVKVDLGSWQQAMARLDECAACGHVDERRVSAWADARRNDAMVFQAVPPPRTTSILSRVGH